MKSVVPQMKTVNISWLVNDRNTCFVRASHNAVQLSLVYANLF